MVAAMRLLVLAVALLCLVGDAVALNRGSKEFKRQEKRWLKQCGVHWDAMQRRGWNKYPGAKIDAASKKRACEHVAHMMSKHQQTARGADMEIPGDAGEAQVQQFYYYSTLMGMKKELFEEFPRRAELAPNKNAALYVAAELLLKELKERSELVTIEYLIENSTEEDEDED